MRGSASTRAAPGARARTGWAASSTGWCATDPNSRSGLGAYYYLRFVALIFRRVEAPALAPLRWSDRTLLALATGMTLLLGVRPDLLLDLVRTALG